MDFQVPPRVQLGIYPTPLVPTPRLSEAFGGPTIYIKRDDLTGVTLTGNKIRKIEFLLAEAQAQKAEMVITCGGVQSNHARTTAIAARQLGMKAHLVLRNNGGKALDGNLFLDRMVGAEITFVSHEEYERVDAIMEDIAGKYAAEGIKAYVVPEGGSNGLGAMGYVMAMQELATQIRESKKKFDAVVLAVGSGGTQAGLVIGRALYDVPVDIIGINICDNAEFFQQRIREIVHEARRRFSLPEQLESEPIQIIDGYVGKGYGLSRQEEIVTIKQVAELEGIILDPVYTGKAMYGLKDLIAQGHFKQGQNIIFLHTGGIFGLFPKRNLFF
ncbi:MAG: D-cysteine desulfhydrase family protein [candidate division KSB1 bacterium]|nr:D-cysteine desulfhydrase family protein [candidate division KSB1 bacterium]MDQ7062750.1 D-cysteine desulfhydrase family protein [candidate division KSB1 bacterium]